ncbi:MAG: stage II sporulation protein R [Clostridia bacterium]|nr:stage II sporulation protein R [Clostridia bacterium]
MKKILTVAFILVLLAAAAVIGLGGQSLTASANKDYLRIHVRANSNMETDQSIKYIVKDEVVKFITPYVAECVDKPSAMRVISGILPELEEVCDRVLREHGFYYGARASVREESFPTRVYGELTLEEGIYDALIIELGTGTGDNWWCVIYPPLCFTAATADVEYRSAIYEIIQKFFN